MTKLTSTRLLIAIETTLNILLDNACITDEEFKQLYIDISKTVEAYVLPSKE